MFWVGKRKERNLCGPLQLKALPHIRVHFYNSPSLGKVGPVSHDYSAQHHIVLGEVTVEQISGSHHGHTKHIGYLHTQRDTLTNFIPSPDSRGTIAESLSVNIEFYLCGMAANLSSSSQIHLLFDTSYQIELKIPLKKYKCMQTHIRLFYSDIPFIHLYMHTYIYRRLAIY